jgi:hypothetical protein
VETLDPRLARTGALAAFGVAAAYLFGGICAALMPPELQGRPDVGPHLFWTVLSRDPAAHLAFHVCWVAAGLCGLAAVPVLSAALWRVHPGAALWSGAAAWLGFAVHARSHLMELAFDRKIIPLYEGASPAFQEAVHVAAGLALDVPDGALTYGAIGIWVALAGLLARRAGAPRPFAALGCAAGLALLLGFAGYALRVRPLLVLAIGAGGVLVPAWFVWAGLLLRAQRGDEGLSPSARAAPPGASGRGA